MKRMFCLLFLCLFVTISLSAQYIIVNGRIKDVDTMMVLLKSISKCDTAFTNNGKFRFKRKLTTPELFTLICIKNQQSINAIRENNERKMRSMEDGVSRELFLEAGNIMVTSTFADIKSVNILLLNRTTQTKYEDFKKRFNPLVKMARTIIDSSYKPKRTETETKIFDMLYKRIEEIENEVAEKFVIENKDNAAGAYILYRYCRIENHDKLDSLYQLFNPSLKASAYLKNISDKIKSLAALKPGENAPSLVAVTNNNTQISLSGFTGKYVVLDFWGSWCMPCINGIPKMKEYYNKYHSDVEFIGIACNETSPAWKEAIRKYNLTWHQILNAEGKNNIVTRYNVEAYPTKILLDRNGKFMESFIGENENFYRKLDSLFEKADKQ